MTDFESEAVRTLFQDADLEHVPASRDLIGPAVAWGSSRRRRDRWTAAGVTGVVAAVAVAGVMALRPGGGPEAVSPGHVGPTQSSANPSQQGMTGTAALREQELLDLLTPYLPAGDRITCQDLGGTHSGECNALMVSGITGTNYAQWSPGIYDYQASPADSKYCHAHKATAMIPLVSGSVAVPGGTVQVTSADCEAQVNAQAGALTEPAALTFHEAAYEFVPSGVAPAYSMELFELVREMPWKPGDEIADAHALWGFDQNGPVLSPQQFATLVNSPVFGDVRQQVADLNLEAAPPATGAPPSPSHSR